MTTPGAAGGWLVRVSGVGVATGTRPARSRRLGRVGSGHREPSDGGSPDPERAPLIVLAFELYATASTTSIRCVTP